MSDRLAASISPLLSPPLHIIYTRSALLLSRRAYASWWAIQAEFADYQTSLGPWPVEEMIDFLHEEYPDLWPSAAAQVAALLAGDAEQAMISFAAPRFSR